VVGPPLRERVSYRGVTLQIAPQPHRVHDVRAKVRIHECEDGTMAVVHNKLRLGRHDREGRRLAASNGAGREATS
jgi:hypothetical protein